jgi:hypothetical protein
MCECVCVCACVCLCACVRVRVCVCVQDELKNLTITGDIVSINLTGVDHLTDNFFWMMRESKVKFHHLTQLKCDGNALL